MADDIDIEEHDVMDNPRIKNMFPDIMTIKTEIIEDEDTSQFKEENAELEEDFDYSNISDTVPMDYECSDVPDIYPNKIILGSKPCSVAPESDEEEPDIIDCSVVLEDWGPILENSPYCKPCKILFPTENVLDAHKMSVHSFLVAVSHNKAIKSTSKSSISAKLKIDKPSGVLCNHCNKYFPDEIALIKHSYALLPGKFECDQCDVVLDSEVALKSHKLTHKPAGGYISCPICTSLFRFAGSIVAHMRKNHGILDVVLPPRTHTEMKCQICNRPMSSIKTLKHHITYTHLDLYNKKVTKSTNKFECRPCNVTFATAYSEKIHKVSKHSNVANKAKPFLMPEVKVTAVSNQIDEFQRPIPKSTLFKCDKCQIHFVSCLMAVEHSKRCTLKKGDWKCRQCRRSFKISDRQSHLKQHAVSERLKVIKIRDGILDRIICRCVSCEICFDERTLLKYHPLGCSNDQSVLCSICNVRVHEHAFKKHARLHNEGGAEFVVIDFIFKEQLTNTATKEPVKALKKRKVKEKFYYFCPSCKFYLKINKHCHKHDIGKCKKNFERRLCKSCGLCFNTKSFKTHKHEHSKFPDLTLHDLTFKNTQTGQEMNPPCPDFKKCVRCKVHFFSKMALSNHVCNVEDCKTCSYCSEKFSDLAYKLHVPFHEYGNNKKLDAHIPELLKKYESLKTLWNILYLCMTCDTVVDNYDKVVEHCQDHYRNMESYNVTIKQCAICDLKFAGDSFERHENLHSENDLSRRSFQIIKYRYDRLLSNDWYDIFKSLAPYQVEQILNKSVYKNNRTARMTPLGNKLADFTNDSYVTMDDSVQSIKDKKTEDLKFIRCHHCGKLINKGKYKKHLTHHKYYTPKNKTVQANLKKNQPKYVVRPKFKTVASKIKYYMCKKCDICVFRPNIKYHLCSNSNHKKQCHKCLLWFRSTSLKNHYHYHEKYKLTRNNMNVMYFKDGKILKGDNVTKELKNKLVVYQCAKCKMCRHSKKYIDKHGCMRDTYMKICHLCDVPFHAAHFEFHRRLHETKQFSKKNLAIVVYEPKNTAKNTKKLLAFAKLKNRDTTPSFTEKSKTANEIEKHLNFELSIKAFHRKIQNRFFKCHLCKILFVTLSSMYEHLKCCDRNDYGAVCHDCGLVFHSSAIHLHKKWQRCATIREARRLNFVSVISKKVVLFDINRTICICRQCNICYVNLDTLFAHVDSGHNTVTRPVKCDECDLLFSSVSNKKHKKLHHEIQNLSSSEVIVLAIETKSSTRALKESAKYNVDDESDVNCEDDTSVADNSILDVRKSIKRKYTDENPIAVRKQIKGKTDNENLKTEVKTSHNKSITKKIDYELSITGFHKRLNTRFYKCHICRNLFITLSSLYDHVKSCDCNDIGVKCNDCGLIFNSSALKVHKWRQKCANFLEVRKLHFISVISENIVNFDDMRSVYFCRQCDICYMTLETLFRHVDGNHVKVLDPIKCDECNLTFSSISKAKHKKLHHESQNLSSSEIIVLVMETMSPSKAVSEYEDLTCKVDEMDYENGTSLKNNSDDTKPNKRKYTKEDSIAIETQIKELSDDENIECNNTVESLQNTYKKKKPNYELSKSGFHRGLNSRFYKCHKCKNLFVTLSSLYEHLKCCDHDRGVICSDCGLLFHSSAVDVHNKWQKCACIREATRLYIVSVISEDVDVFDDTRNVYLCRQCDLYYLNLNTLILHMSDDHKMVTSRVKCNECDLTFTNISNTKHKKLHHEKQSLSLSEIIVLAVETMDPAQAVHDSVRLVGHENGEQYEDVVRKQIKDKSDDENSESTLITKVQNTSETKSVNYELSLVGFHKRMHTRFYRCHICKTLFVTLSSLFKHVKCCDRDEKGANCDGCGLVFHPSSINVHNDWQKCAVIRKAKRLHFVSIISKDVVVLDDTRSVYVCRQCDIYFLTLDTLYKHLDNGHVISINYVACDECGLAFATKSLHKHKKLHHEIQKLSLPEIIILAVETMSLPKPVQDSPTFTDLENEVDDESDASESINLGSKRRKSIKRNSVRKQAKEKSNDESINSKNALKYKYINVNGVYQCEVCKLNFLTKNSLYKHRLVGFHNQKACECPKCGLMFTQKTIVRHLENHENFPDQTKNSAVESITNENVSDFTDRMSNSVDGNETIEEFAVVENESIENASKFTGKINILLNKHVINESVDNVAVKINTRTPESSRVHNTAYNEKSIKLFKCSACDVYFLTDEVCRDHVDNHQDLDPTEYIACKVCDLQFLCEYLGGHMRTHRNNTFNIDEVIVTEYQPNRVAGDTYLAVDRLKSKLVSTTTHFDTEDEKADSVYSTDTV